MSFQSYKPFKKRNLFPKFTIVFLLGVSFVLLFSQAFTIVTGIENSVQYIKQIVITSDGTSSGTTGIVLDGSNSFNLQVNGSMSVSGSLSGGYAYFTTGQFSYGVQSNNYCNFSGTSCKTIDALSIWNKSGTNVYYTGGNVGIGTDNPQANLEVDSILRLTPTLTTGTCDSSTKGSMSYSSGQNLVCFCNGSDWLYIGSGGTTCTF